MVKNLPANAGDIRDAGLIPRSGRSPGGGHGNSHQYSCLENPVDRGAWWAAIYGVQGRQGPRGCIPGSPGESGLVSILGLRQETLGSLD